MTLPEVLLWQALRQRRNGVKFRRQHAAGPYILDFYAADAKLAVEIDGMVHAMGNNPQRDLDRDAWLTCQGIAILRLPATDVLKDLDAAVTAILGAVRQRHPSTIAEGAMVPLPAKAGRN